MKDSHSPSSLNLPSTSDQLPIAVDAMGGDFGPQVIIEGALQAANELGIASILVGRKEILEEKVRALGGQNNKRIQICHAEEEISMEESPSMAIRGKPNCSIRIAYDLVKEKKASAIVSAGNTGAVMAAGLYVVGSLPGIGRPAIASLIPKVGAATPTVLLDSGANIDCHAHQLVQFALMGTYYAKSIIPCENPRVALLSNGAESSKGNDITRSAAVMLSEIQEVNYVGYIEGRDISSDIADVVVCDGFIGNIVLKTMEGSVGLVFDSIQHHIKNSARGRLGIWLAEPIFKWLFKNKLDPSAYGGAPLLGLNEISIICHGSATRRAILNGIRVARKFAEEKMIAKVSQALDSLDVRMPGEYEDGMWDRMGQKFDKPKKAKKGIMKTSRKEKEIKGMSVEEEGRKSEESGHEI